ncbi:MAG: VWA domain-containing protein [Pyrinomonadaceae bacterium]
MKRIYVTFLTFVFAILIKAGFPVSAGFEAATQQAQISQDESSVEIREVRIPVSVINKKKIPITDLSANDFSIYEDKKQQQVTGFFAFSDDKNSQPLYIAMLIDTSTSTAGKISFERDAAQNFIHTVARLRKDFFSLVTFDHEINLRQDFTTNLGLIDKAIDKIKEPGRQTALYDAVWQTCDEKMRYSPGRRAIVIITDGDDTYSRARLNEAIDIAQRTETTIFAISTKAGFSGTVPGVEAGTVSDRGDRDLEKMCEETGGTTFFTGDVLSLERSFKNIASALRTQYLITYKPANDRYDGSYRKIEVKLSNGQKGLKVLAKSGYLAVAEKKVKTSGQ